MPSGELRLKHVMTNPIYAVSRIRILGSKMHVWNLNMKRYPNPSCLCGITCSGGQLKWGLCVVLRPILQGALHIRSIIQQQLWRGWREVDREGGRGEGENKPGGRIVCYTQAWQEEKPQLLETLTTSFRGWPSPGHWTHSLLHFLIRFCLQGLLLMMTCLSWERKNQDGFFFYSPPRKKLWLRWCRLIIEKNPEGDAVHQAFSQCQLIQ